MNTPEAITSIDTPPARQPLPAGSIIEYLDMQARVIADDGGATLIVEHDETEQVWEWQMEGHLCKVISIGDPSHLVALGRWQTIDSAPRDSSRVLLYREGFAEDQALCWWNGVVGSWMCVQGSEFVGATHWMQSIKPPKAVQASESRAA